MIYDIITNGGAVIDTFLEIDSEKVRKGEVCFPLGQKILVDDLNFATGGGGTNTGVGFSRLGFKTGFLGCVGKDSNSEIILKEIEKEGVEFLGSRVLEPTGYSVIIDSKNKDRTVFTFNGANRELSLGEKDLGKFKTKWFYLSSMNGESFETQKRIAKIASSLGIKIVYNPSNYITKKGAGHLRELLKYVYILVLNRDEAKDLVGNGGNLLKGLHKLGPKIICVTDGENVGEVSLHDGEVCRFIPSKIKVVERTGAGDAFACGFIAGFILKKDIKLAIQWGVLNANSVLGSFGAKKGLLRLKELESEANKTVVKISEL